MIYRKELNQVLGPILTDTQRNCEPLINLIIYTIKWTSKPKRSPVAAFVGSDPEEPPELYRWCNILLIDPHESPPSMCRRLPPLSKCCCLQGSASVSGFCSNLARLGDGGASLSIEFFPTISSVVGTCLSKKIYRPIIGPCARR